MIPAKIPAETACFGSAWKSAVWWDWMVGLEGTELPTPHPVVEPVSDIRVRNGIFRCRDGRVKAEFLVPGDRYGDRGDSKSPRSAGQMHGHPAEFDPYRLGGGG